MIGKVQDMVTAAVFVGSSDKTVSSTAASTQRDAQETDTQQRIAGDASSVSTLLQVQPNGQTGAEPRTRQDKDNQLMDEKSVNLMTNELNELMSKINCNLEFSYHKEVNMMSVKMIDKKTQEVLKEMPPESMIKHMMAAKDWLGAFLDKNA